MTRIGLETRCDNLSPLPPLFFPPELDSGAEDSSGIEEATAISTPVFPFSKIHVLHTLLAFAIVAVFGLHGAFVSIFMHG